MCPLSPIPSVVSCVGTQVVIKDCDVGAPPATSVYASSGGGGGAGGQNSSSGGAGAAGGGAGGSSSGGGKWEVGTVRSAAVQLLGVGSTIVVDGKPFTATIGEDGEPIAPPGSAQRAEPWA